MRRTLFESLTHGPLTEPPPMRDDAALAELARSVERAARRRLGRSLAIREVDAGSCNGCELEIHALNNAFYDLERFGLRFVASPRHADVLLVTGPVTRNMAEALLRTYNATPDPKWVVAVGACAKDGGVFAGSYAVTGGVSAVIPVDLHIAGCPPTPTQLLQGLLSLLEGGAAARRHHLPSAVADLQHQDHERHRKRHDARSDQRAVDDGEPIDQPQQHADDAQRRARQRNRPRIAVANNLGRLRDPAQRRQHGAGGADRLDQSRRQCGECHGAVVCESIRFYCRDRVTLVQRRSPAADFFAEARFVCSFAAPMSSDRHA